MASSVTCFVQRKSPFAYIRHCLAPKVFTSTKGVGFLDRLALRLPASSQTIVDSLTEKHEDIDSRTKLPDTFALFRTGAHVYNNRSDHIQVAHAIDILKRI